MATNSLVANSPFKNLTTREGQLSNGVAPSPDRVIHERRTPNRALGQPSRSAQGSANTPRSAIGLGISGTPTKSPGSAISGTRRVSSGRKDGKGPLIPSPVRRPSSERKVSGSKENESPPASVPKKKRLPRQSMAYKALVENEYVSHSPFLERRDSNNASPVKHQNEEHEGEQEELMPSPPAVRRVSSGSLRRASPSTTSNLAQNRTSMSPSSSPRQTSNATVVPNPSPLREERAALESRAPATPTGPTPTKSSLASSKRLHGPRVYGQESPTRKTVTFQHVPEIKEFDPPSAETSLNMSYEHVDEDDWTDEAEHEDDWVATVVRNDDRNSFDSEEGIADGDVSATADFMDEIFGSDGIEGETPVFADHDRFEIPLEQSFEQSLTLDKVDVGTPLFEYNDLGTPDSPKHVHTTTPHLDPGQQPDLPHTDDHSMLLNADAHQPATHAPHHESTRGPHAHQEGPLFDPFITIQTATDVIVEPKERTEDGVPLGRTSHTERIQARRLLATQSLGLGYPGTLPKAGSPLRIRPDSDSDDSPAAPHTTLPDLPAKEQPQPPKAEQEDVFGAVIASPAARKVSNRVISDVPELQGPSRRMAQFKATKGTPTKGTPKKSAESTPKRGLPRPPPPPPASIDIPSPVQIKEQREETPESEAESATSSSTLHSRTNASQEDVRSAANAYLDLDYALPDIGVSPLISEASDFEDAPAIPESRGPRVSDVAPQLTLPSELVEDAEEVPEEMPDRAARRVSASAPKLELSPEFESTQIEMDVDSSSSDGPATPNPDEDDEPLTPPRRPREQREESPRIPSFDLGDLSIDMPREDVEEREGSLESVATITDTPKPTTIVTAPSPSPVPTTPTRATPGRTTPSPTPGRTSVPSTPTRTSAPSTPLRAGSPASGRATPTATPSRATPSRATSPLASPPVNAPRSMMSEFGPPATKDASEASTNTLVRQRISREAIRQNVNKRMAAEGLTSPRPASVATGSPTGERVSSGKVSFAPPSPAFARHTRGGSSSSLDKELPARPVSAPAANLSAPASPLTPRSPSAISRIREGDRDSPKSALDRIASSFGGDSEPSSPVSVAKERVASAERVVDSPSKVVQPVSILNKSTPAPGPSGTSSIVNTAVTTAAARKARRRSASLGEIEVPARIPSSESKALKPKKTPRVSLGLRPGGEFMMDSVHAELDQIGSGRGYRIRENRRYVRATYTDGVRQSAGDLEDGSRRVWRPASQVDPELRAFKERTASATSAASTTVAEEDPKTLVFVKVLGIEALNLPIPKEATFVTIRVSNGVDTILTPYVQLAEGAAIHREFCLTELENFEFSLALEVRRDAHIVALERALKNPAPAPEVQRLAPPPPVTARAESPISSFSSRTGGFRALFSSPRKSKHQRTQSSMAAIPTQRAPPPPPPAAKPRQPQPVAETLANYLGGDGNKVLGKTHIAIEPIAQQCEAKVLEIRYPMFSMYKNQPSPDGPVRKQVAKITVQILRLPALPGLSISELPGSIDETLKGLRNHLWHQHIYHEGTLTQLGGDCRLPRRRLMRLVGGNLHAINEVTRKEVASIDLSKATEVVDLNARPTSPKADYDPYAARPRSFEVLFNDGESIQFSADKDEDKLVW